MNYIDFQTLKQLGIPCKVVLKDCLFHVLLGLFSNVLLEIFKIYAFQRDEPMLFFPHNIIFQVFVIKVCCFHKMSWKLFPFFLIL